jgi:tRNA (adenine37-N6)-methyltransferase
VALVQVVLRAVAHVRGGRAENRDDHWGDVVARIELVDDVPDDALIGLDAFSHVQVVALADRADDVPPAPWTRRPRGRPSWPEVGVFAQRNKDRPNRLLVSIARIERLEPRRLVVRGLDLIDATPVFDLKPVMAWGGPRGALRTPAWSDELGADYY